MLSIGKMGSGQSAYYLALAREDYYLDGGEPPGQWHGKGAADLGLSGTVQGEELTRAFEGFHPREDHALIKNAGQENHQPGWDLTFSAPKSVSTLWSQAAQETRQVIEEAHAEAVKAGLAYIEQNAAFTRRGAGGQEKEKARLVIATFEHGTSRAMEPQLHTHSLVLNVCTREDGTTGTIESKPIYQAKMTAGAIYQAELAYQLESRLNLTIQKDQVAFKVVGVSERLCDAFSTRLGEIEESLAEKGYDSPEAAAKAALSTRSVKGHVARSELFADWHGTGESLGWGQREAGELIAKGQALERNREQERGEALETTTERLTLQQSHFSERDFIRRMAEESQGRGIGARELQEAAEKHLKESPEIVALGERNGQRLYTTLEMLEIEKGLLETVERSKGADQAGVSERTMNGVVSSRLSMSEEQKKALLHVTEEGASIRVVSGMAGTGKTTLLNAARMSWELEGFEVHGAALSGKAASGLEEGAKIKSGTLHRTLLDLHSGKLQLHEKSVLVVDEAGMVGTRHMAQLVEATEKTRARLVLVGDARQLQSIEAGGAFSEISKRLGAAELTGIVRQREEWAREAVKDFAYGRSDEAIYAFAERGLLRIGETRQDAYKELIASWKTQGVHEPEDQLIFTGTRHEAAILNRMAQAERKRAGVLSDESVSPKPGSESFYEGDRVLFMKNSKREGVSNGSLGTITSVDEENQKMNVCLDSGSTTTIRFSDYDQVKLGYAMTSHKGQGATVERAFILAGGAMQDREISYVQASRTRGETQIFTDREEAGDNLTRLVRQMGESRQKEMATVIERELSRRQDDHAQRMSF